MWEDFTWSLYEFCRWFLLIHPGVRRYRADASNVYQWPTKISHPSTYSPCTQGLVVGSSWINKVQLLVSSRILSAGIGLNTTSVTWCFSLWMDEGHRKLQLSVQNAIHTHTTQHFLVETILPRAQFICTSSPAPRLLSAWLFSGARHFWLVEEQDRWPVLCLKEWW